MKNLLKILTIALFINSCTSPTEKADVSGIELSTPIDRFDRDLFKAKDEAAVEELQANYPFFYDIFTKNVIGIREPGSTAAAYYINSFIDDAYIKQVKDKCEAVFPDLKAEETAFTDAFKRYKYYFPDKPVPRVISFLSGFSYTIVVDDSLLGFGLDMYLGSDCEFYPKLGIPKYKFMNMDRDHIVADCMKGWIATEYEPGKQNNDLLSIMVYHGKLLYALDLLLPETAGHIKAGYSAEQLKWCQENEAEIWFHFIDRELLFSHDNSVFTKYMNEGPFTPGFPEGSPGQIGIWVGWQIISKYMENNPGISLQQLMESNISASDILNQSKYKPKK